MRRIDKDIFLDALVCPNLAWIKRSGRYPQLLTPGERYRIEEGIGVHEFAHELFPEGVEIIERDMTMAAKATQDVLGDYDIMFEPAFLDEPFATRADILVKRGAAYKLIEVKTSTKEKPIHIDDMAFTLMVLAANNIKIDKLELWILNPDYRLHMSDEKLFNRLDVTEEVIWRSKLFETLRADIDEVTSETDLPLPIFKWECKGCPYNEECFPFKLKNHIFTLPNLTREKFESLVEAEIVRIEDIPEGFNLSQQQKMVKDCVDTGKIYVSDSLKKDLKKIKWPAYYLDFETVHTAIPLYPDVAPYEQVVTQFSIYKCSEPGKVVDHHEYLAHPKRDRRRELALRLIRDLEDEGSVIVYSSFEKTIIKGLIELYPDLKRELNAIIDRIVDLYGILRKDFYHPMFKGSISIKNVLPVLVPDMTYEDMEIASGDSAIAAFADMARGRYDQKEWDHIRRALLDYCGHDTLAMVKIHQSLLDFV